MSYQTLRVDVRNRVATVVISRPEKLNALNALAKEELRDCIVSMARNDEIAAVIITGAGEKSFVAGTDIAELAELDGAAGKRFAERGQEIFNLIERLDKPVIAAVNGYALGGGCELALACHLRLASEKARFGQPEVQLGVIPGYGGTQRLARLVGRGRALEMILTGAQVDAEEAYRIGLVNRVVPAGELLARAQAMAEQIASMAPRALAFALRAVAAAGETTLGEGLRREAELFGSCCDTEDFREGTAAFLQKRKPVFRGR